MPEYMYAILSAILWACSAPIINSGLNQLPSINRNEYIVTGLFFAILSGLVTTLLLSSESIEFTSTYNNIYTILAGLLTFPIATGLYYITSSTYKNKAEMASQFAKVKPILSVILAILILGESFSNLTLIATGLMIIGSILLFRTTRSHSFPLKAFILGMLTAFAWSAGEVFVKLGFTGPSTSTSTFHALLSSFFFMLVVISLMAAIGRRPRFELKSVIAFSAHGVLSFGFAYTLFFHSIKTLGLGYTILINSFWPILALLITCALNVIFKNAECNIPTSTWIASATLLSGSILTILSVYYGL